MKEKFALFFRLGFYVSIVLLLISIPFYFSKIYRLGIYFLSISYPLEYIFSERYKLWKWQKSMWFYLAAIALFLISPLWELFFTRDFSNEIFTDNLRCMFPFFAFGAIGFLGFPSIRIRWVALLSLSVIILASIYILFKVDLTNFFSTINNLGNPFNSYRCKEISSHMRFNLYANVSLIFGYFVLRNKSEKFPLRFSVGIMMALVCLIIFITEGRIGYTTMLLLVTLMLTSVVWRKNVRLALIFFLGLVLSVNYLLSNHGRIGSENIGAREDIWRVAIETVKTSPIVGHGVINGRETFVKKGMNDSCFFENFAKPGIIQNPKFGENGLRYMDPHNAVLELWIEFGIFGVSLFFIMMILPLLFCEKEMIFSVFMMIFTIGMQAMTESYSSGFSPMICIFFMMCLLQKKENSIFSP